MRIIIRLHRNPWRPRLLSPCAMCGSTTTSNGPSALQHCALAHHAKPTSTLGAGSSGSMLASLLTSSSSRPSNGPLSCSIATFPSLPSLSCRGVTSTSRHFASWVQPCCSTSALTPSSHGTPGPQPGRTANVATDSGPVPARTPACSPALAPAATPDRPGADEAASTSAFRALAFCTSRYTTSCTSASTSTSSTSRAAANTSPSAARTASCLSLPSPPLLQQLLLPPAAPSAGPRLRAAFATVRYLHGDWEMVGNGYQGRHGTVRRWLVEWLLGAVSSMGDRGGMAPECGVHGAGRPNGAVRLY